LQKYPTTEVAAIKTKSARADLMLKRLIKQRSLSKALFR